MVDVMYKEIVRACPLFTGIEDRELEQLLGCLGVKYVSYQKDEFIFRTDEKALFVGVVLSGAANVIQEDYWGNRVILGHVSPGELFGEAFSCAESNKLQVSAVATEPSVIMQINYRRILTVCPASCVFHTRLITNMLKVLANKNILLTRKIEHISRRTTKEKLLSFLSDQALLENSSEIVVPYNRQELADFLCVERSALSRELGEMKREGLLDYEKNRFVLH
ncbi:MAG TPA: Crp/Fnr family transcriptional regulator [Candidatus Acidoferrum sp.]|nr:Crp/Fnr family transcriptional regulator [Candidatus Acidoferrum sp.]